MKILFVSSTNKRNKIVPFIDSQRQSLIKLGLQVDVFEINNKGLIGYIRNIRRLSNYLEYHKYDIIHAHYVLSGLVVALTFTKTPIVLSFMGSDIYGKINSKNRTSMRSVYLILLSLLIQPFVSFIILKSHNLSKLIYKKSYEIIPNGVDLTKFLSNRITCNPKKIVFLSDTKDPRKNFTLAKESFKLLKNIYKNVELITPFPCNQEEVIEHLNSASLLIATSYREGSPNIIKEAMACNCPIVTTDVGDVRFLLGNTYGNYICQFNANEISSKMLLILTNEIESNGRDAIKEKKLTDIDIAKRLLTIYKKVAKQ